ncbi:MAG: bifunctional nuclease family protein [Verrucomicrobiota bacterium]|jgi:bifunctional DNase/RNase
MSDGSTLVQILGLMPAANGMAVFLGNEKKTFSIHVDHGVGTSIALLLKGEKRERPLTHDLIHLIFQGFGITVDRVLINDLRNDTYFARLTLRQVGPGGTSITEIDARPSDCVAVALETQKPIHVAKAVWDKVSDMTPFLQELKKKFETGEEGEEGQAGGEAKGEGEQPRDGGKGPRKKS